MSGGIRRNIQVLLFAAADKAAHVGTVYGPYRDPLKPAGSFAA